MRRFPAGCFAWSAWPVARCKGSAKRGGKTEQKSTLKNNQKSCWCWTSTDNLYLPFICPYEKKESFQAKWTDITCPKIRVRIRRRWMDYLDLILKLQSLIHDSTNDSAHNRKCLMHVLWSRTRLTRGHKFQKVFVPAPRFHASFHKIFINSWEAASSLSATDPLIKYLVKIRKKESTARPKKVQKYEPLRRRRKKSDFGRCGDWTHDLSHAKRAILPLI